MTRMFVAVRPPESALEHLDEFLEVRREAAPFRWSAVEQLHVTLAFLESVADRHLDDLVDRLAEAAARRTPFSVRLAGGGAFPDAARARVLWAGLDLDVTAATELDRLATGARNAAVAAGTTVDGQRFRPHVTVARLGRPAEVTRWVRLLDAYQGPTWTVDDDRAGRLPPRRGPTRPAAPRAGRRARPGGIVPNKPHARGPETGADGWGLSRWRARHTPAEWACPTVSGRGGLRCTGEDRSSQGDPRGRDPRGDGARAGRQADRARGRGPRRAGSRSGGADPRRGVRRRRGRPRRRRARPGRRRRVGAAAGGRLRPPAAPGDGDAVVPAGQPGAVAGRRPARRRRHRLRDGARAPHLARAVDGRADARRRWSPATAARSSPPGCCAASSRST